MEKTIAVVEICKISIFITWIISAFWLGYLIGKQTVYTKSIEKDYNKFKDELDEVRKI